MEKFINSQSDNNLYIMRAVPGCGKSHRAQRLSQEISAPIFSADAFFGEGEVYKSSWKIEKAHLGHRDCEVKTLAAMKSGLQNIIVDNTSISLQAFRVYLDYALDYDYGVTFVYPDSHWWVEVVEPFLRNKKESTSDLREIATMLAEKTVHGVPVETIMNMLERFQWVTYEDYMEATIQRLASLKMECKAMSSRVDKLGNALFSRLK